MTIRTFQSRGWFSENPGITRRSSLDLSGPSVLLQSLNTYFSPALIHRHAGVLGLASCIQAFPYDVPSWMPQLLLDLGEHLHDPHPIQVRQFVNPPPPPPSLRNKGKLQDGSLFGDCGSNPTLCLRP